MAGPDVPCLKLYRGATYQPRWEPSPKLRALGFKGQALKDDAGAYLPIEAAVAAAHELNAVAEARIALGQRAPRQGAFGQHPRSVGALWELYKASPTFKMLAPNTQKGYETWAAIIIAKLGAAPVASIEKHHLHNWWEALYRERGHSSANAILRVLSLMLSYATLKGWRRDNPASKLGMISVPPRVVVWFPDECETFVATADAIWLPGVGDAFVVALHTAQRLSDVLELLEARADDNRVRFRQGKTDARVSVPITDQLRARLDAIKARRAAGDVVDLAQSRRLVLRPDGSKYDRHSFNKDFLRVRAVTAARLGRRRAEVASKQFLDLRDTAITRLALAGCTVPEIRAISGHSLQTVHQVLKHYLARDDRLADHAIARLKVYMADEGIAI